MGSASNTALAVESDDLRTAGLILIPFVILFILALILIHRKYRKEIRPVQQQVRNRKAASEEKIKTKEEHCDE